LARSGHTAVIAGIAFTIILLYLIAIHSFYQMNLYSNLFLLSSCSENEFFRSSFFYVSSHIVIDANSVLGLLHRVDMGDVAIVLEKDYL
jgi:hypothetical protein